MEFIGTNVHQVIELYPNEALPGIYDFKFSPHDLFELIDAWHHK